MKIHSDTPSEEARIEIIPLIDVIFCILTFFILASLQLTRQQGINVDLPQANSAIPQMREMLMVSLDDFQQVYVETQLMSSREQLLEVVKNYKATNPNGLMVLSATKDASYNDVVQILDLLRSVGGDRVALATVPTNPQPVPGANPGVPATPAVPNNVLPYPGSTVPAPYNPYNLPNQATPPYNPGQPPLPVNPGQLPLPVNPGQLPNGQGTIPSYPGGVPTDPNIQNPGATTIPGTNGSVIPNGLPQGATGNPAQTQPVPRR